MKIIFHVGHSKTGSTALQSVFLASQAQLLERGVLYPANPNGIYNNHRLLFADLMAPGKVPRHILKNYSQPELPAARQELEDAIRADLSRTNPRCLVLSSESRFGVMLDESRVAFRKLLISFGSDDIDIVAYIRSPASWFLSALNQKTLHAWRIRQPRVLNVRRPVEQFVEDFGPDHVKLRPFSRDALIGGDIVTDFCGTSLRDYDIPLDALAGDSTANQSLPTEAMDIVSRYRHHFMHDDDDKFLPEGKKLLDTIRKAASRFSMPKPKLLANIAEAIDYSNTHILWLRDVHGLVMPNYDYARVEGGKKTKLPKENLKLEEIVGLDRDLQAELIMEMVQSRWVQSDSDRAAWFANLSGQIREDINVSRTYNVAITAPHIPEIKKPIGEISMTVKADVKRTPQEQADRDTAVAIGRAIFRAEQKGKTSDKSVRKQAWVESRHSYVKQGRAILKQLRKDGFDLTKPEA